MCVHHFCHVGLVSLNLLDLSGNSFSTIPRHLPSSVEQLYLSNNSLTGLDVDSFEGFLNLKYLRLSHCGLQNREVHSQVFNHSSLVELDLSYNKLTAIPTVPTTLQYLYLEANKIQGEDYTFSKACTDIVEVLLTSRLLIFHTCYHSTTQSPAVIEKKCGKLSQPIPFKNGQLSLLYADMGGAGFGWWGKYEGRGTEGETRKEKERKEGGGKNRRGDINWLDVWKVELVKNKWRECYGNICDGFEGKSARWARSTCCSPLQSPLSSLSVCSPSVWFFWLFSQNLTHMTI